MQEVKSSNISHLGYDISSKILKVRFKTGSEYEYANVSQETFVGLLNSESVGKTFQKSVKAVAAYRKSGETNWTEVVRKEGEKT